MTDPEETLAAIDAAVDGWADYDSSVSDDAMRWAPERPARTWRGARPTLSIPDEAHGLLGPVRETVTLTPQQAQVFRDWADHVRRQHDGVRRAFQTLAKHVLRAVARTHVTTAPLTYGDGYRRHRRRCRTCNPAGNPKPLKVNGADYARRRKNRRRRR